jgi:hypothetical protein
MPDEPTRGYGQNGKGGLSDGDGPHSGRSQRVPDRRSASTDVPSPADPRSAACSRDFAVTPGDLDGDDWDQEAALAAFMADIESGYDLFTSSIGLEADDADWPPTGEQDAGPAADTAVLPPEAYPASGNTARIEGGPARNRCLWSQSALMRGSCRVSRLRMYGAVAAVGSRRGMYWILRCRVRRSRGSRTLPPARPVGMRGWMMMS